MQRRAGVAILQKFAEATRRPCQRPRRRAAARRTRAQPAAAAAAGGEEERSGGDDDACTTRSTASLGSAPRRRPPTESSCVVLEFAMEVDGHVSLGSSGAGGGGREGEEGRARVAWRRRDRRCASREDGPAQRRAAPPRTHQAGGATPTGRRIARAARQARRAAEGGCGGSIPSASGCERRASRIASHIQRWVRLRCVTLDHVRDNPPPSPALECSAAAPRTRCKASPSSRTAPPPADAAHARESAASTSAARAA